MSIEGKILKSLLLALLGSVFVVLLAAPSIAQNSPELRLTTNDTPDPALTGKPLTYKFTVTNIDNKKDAKDVKMQYVMPEGVGFETVSTTSGTSDKKDGCTRAGSDITCEFKKLKKSGGSASVEVKVVPNRAGDLVAEVSARADKVISVSATERTIVKADETSPGGSGGDGTSNPENSPAPQDENASQPSSESPQTGDENANTPSDPDDAQQAGGDGNGSPEEPAAAGEGDGGTPAEDNDSESAESGAPDGAAPSAESEEESGSSDAGGEATSGEDAASAGGEEPGSGGATPPSDDG